MPSLRLLRLKFQIIVNSLLYSLEIRFADLPLPLDVLSHLFWIAPAIDPFEEAHISKHTRRRPAFSTSAMYVYLMILICDQVVQLFGTVKKLLSKCIFIKIWNRKVDRCDAALFVEGLHMWPVLTPVNKVLRCQNIEDACDSRFLELIDMFLVLRIWANKYGGFGNWVKIDFCCV